MSPLQGVAGGTYNTKTISTTGGCQYRVCAGGVYRCCSRECNGCIGCSSYVNGYNLSNFCGQGGARGCANTDWSVACTSRNFCCVSPGQWGGDFAMVFLTKMVSQVTGTVTVLALLLQNVHQVLRS